MIGQSDVEAARETIGNRITRTPLIGSSQIGAMIGARILIKAENLQKTGAFKPRGALNKVSSLSAAERERGIIAVSAGNHAQGVAWSATASGVKSTIVMASSASHSKVAATRGYGAEVVLVDGGIAEAFRRTDELQAERGLTLVHPFDDNLIIAGQGTVGLEILDDAPDVSVIVCPIGGGGLISGIAIAAKEQRPDIRIYGVEPVGADVMRRSLEAGKPVQMQPETIADGLASPVGGELTTGITSKYLEDLITLSDDEILAGLKTILTYTKLYAEPAGAAATAALLAGKIPLRSDDTVVSILSGGNFDLDVLKTVL